MVEVAVYQGEKILCVGTYDECSKETGLTVNSLRKYATPSWLKYVEDSENNPKPRYTARRKYDRRLLEHKDKENIMIVYKNNKRIHEGTVEEAMEITGYSKCQLYWYASPTGRKTVQEASERSLVTVYRLDDDE